MLHDKAWKENLQQEYWSNVNPNIQTDHTKVAQLKGKVSLLRLESVIAYSPK